MRKFIVISLLFLLTGCESLKKLPFAMELAHFKAEFCALTPQERLQIRKDIRAVKCAAIGDVHSAIQAFCGFAPETQAFIMPIIDAKMCGLPNDS